MLVERLGGVMQRGLLLCRVLGAAAALPPTRRVLLALVLGASVVAAGCGGGKGSAPAGDASAGTISGLVVKGRVVNATVTAYRLDAAMIRGTALATATTSSDGTFTVTIPPYNGHIEVVAAGGVYPEEAVGVNVQLTRDLSTVVPSFQAGSVVSVTVSPISSIAHELAKAEFARGSSLLDAIGNAWTHVNSHFGGLDWRSVVPTNVTPSEPVTVTLSDPTKAGVILAGLSQNARGMAEASGLSPGTSVSGATLAGAAIDDAKDGTLDGNGNGAAVVQGSVTLDGNTFRRALGQSILQFVSSSRNKTQLTPTDVLALATALAANGDPYLFCPDQAATPECAGGPLNLEPATVTFVDPPTFVSAPTVTLTATAQQPVSGISAVYARSSTDVTTTVAGTFSAGVWTLTGVPLVEGVNQISVWAIDGTGAGSITNARTITVVRDTTPPNPFVQASKASYFDERPMTLVDGSVPPAYQFPEGAVKVAPFLDGGVYKASTRLSWSAAPSPVLLEGANPDNVPFVQIGIPVSASEAPIATATYAVAVNGGPAVTGDLLPWSSPASNASMQYYDLPLAANLFASLATSTASATNITIAANFTDAAGNAGSITGIALSFRVYGGPLVVEEDLAFSTYADVKSTYPYRLTNNTYATLFDPAAPPFYDAKVRLIRYVLKNPAPVPVAVRANVTPGGGSSWTARETWSAASVRATTAPNPYTTSPDNCTYSGVMATNVDGLGIDFNNCSAWAAPCITPYNASTPPTLEKLSGFPTHVMGDLTNYGTAVWPTYWTCKPENWHAGTFTVATSEVLAQVFSGPLAAAGEVALPQTISGFSVVPAASGGAAGTLVLYLARPAAAPRTRPLGSWGAVTGSARYERLEGYVYKADNYAFCYWYTGFPYSRWICPQAGHRATGFLSAAEESIEVTLALTTQGVSGAALAGESIPRHSTTVSRSFATH